MKSVTFTDQYEAIAWDRVTAWLTAAQWSRGINRAEVEMGACHSALVVGAWCEGELVGFARVVSDCVRFAYLMDVIVAPEHRRQGIGQGMVRFALEHPRLKWVYSWMLRTRDAQGVYAKVGFKTIVDPEQWMLIQSARPKREGFPEV